MAVFLALVLDQLDFDTLWFLQFQYDFDYSTWSEENKATSEAFCQMWADFARQGLDQSDSPTQASGLGNLMRERHS